MMMINLPLVFLWLSLTLADEDSCQDHHKMCHVWKAKNACEGNERVQQSCPLSCGLCRSTSFDSEVQAVDAVVEEEEEKEGDDHTEEDDDDEEEEGDDDEEEDEEEDDDEEEDEKVVDQEGKDEKVVDQEGKDEKVEDEKREEEQEEKQEKEKEEKQDEEEQEQEEEQDEKQEKEQDEEEDEKQELVKDDKENAVENESPQQHDDSSSLQQQKADEELSINTEDPTTQTDCVDEHPDCTQWIQQTENACLMQAPTMTMHCRHSCGYCHQTEEYLTRLLSSTTLGVPQYDTPHATHDIASLLGMAELAYGGYLHNAGVPPACRNDWGLCAYFATRGYCTTDFMKQHCAPSCQLC